MLENDQIKFNIIAEGPERFFWYAISTIYGLITNGDVCPNSIVFNLSEDYFKYYQEIEALKRLGVTLLSGLGHLGKPYYVKRVFELYPETKTVVQLDSDVFLNKKENLYDFVKRFQNCDIATYTSNVLEAYSTLHTRGVLLDNQYSYNEPIKRTNLEQFIQKTYNLKLDELLNWIKKQRWLHGGICIYNATVLNKKAWQEILDWTKISCCDETAILFSIKSDKAFKWEEISQDTLTHYFSGENMRSFDRARMLGFMHFAGDWFRCQVAHKDIDQLNAEAAVWLKNI